MVLGSEETVDGTLDEMLGGKEALGNALGVELGT